MHERHVRVLSVDNNKQNCYIPAAYKQGESCWFSEALLWRLWFPCSSWLILILTLAINRSHCCLCVIFWNLHNRVGDLIGWPWLLTVDITGHLVALPPLCVVV